MKLEVGVPAGDREWLEAIRILKQLRPYLNEQELFERRHDLTEEGYHLLVLLLDGEVVAVGGGFIYPHLLHGRDFWVLDLVTEEGSRGKGYGLRLLQELESLARAQGCHRVCVHTERERKETQKFYEGRAAYGEPYAVVFRKTLR